MELKRWNALVSLSSVALQTCFATFIWKPFVCALCNKLSLSIVEVLHIEDFHMLYKLWLAAAWVAAMWEREERLQEQESYMRTSNFMGPCSGGCELFPSTYDAHHQSGDCK